ncbi:MAG: hypothetical protein ACLP7P_01435 [Rhodomicrobium sp.]
MSAPIQVARLAGLFAAILLMSCSSGTYAAGIAAKLPVLAEDSHARLILISLPAGRAIATSREEIALAVPGPTTSPERTGTASPAYELKTPRGGASFSGPAPMPPVLVRNPFLPKAP